MKIKLIALAALIAASVWAPRATHTQQLGDVTRKDLQRHDLSIPGHEMIQVLVGFAPGVVAPRHSHPGEEIVNVVEGTIEYQLDGQPPMTLKAGDDLFIPAGAVHGARNDGTGHASELATYIVEKGKPLVTLGK
jgi:quercetin dioxygenase-like cupin family protein